MDRKIKIWIPAALLGLAVIVIAGIYVRNNKYQFMPKTESNLFTLAQISAGKGDHEKAVVYFQQLLDKDPKHAFAIRLMVESLLKSGKQDKIIEWLDKIVELDPSKENLEFAISTSLQIKNKEKAEEFIQLSKKLESEKKINE